MSKKLTFHCVSGRDLLTVGLPALSTRMPELNAVLTRLASYDRRGRLVSKEIIEKGVKYVQKIDFPGNHTYFATILE